MPSQVTASIICESVGQLQKILLVCMVLMPLQHMCVCVCVCGVCVCVCVCV